MGQPPCPRRSWQAAVGKLTPGADPAAGSVVLRVDGDAFLLMAGMDPCPRGYRRDGLPASARAAGVLTRYQNR